MTSSMIKHLDAIDTRARLALVPPKRLDINDWIEDYIYVGSGATQGPMRMYAYLRALSDAVMDPEIEKITVVKSARIGYSQWLYSVLAYYIVHEPSQILFMLPADQDAREVAIELDSLFAASLKLRGMLQPGVSEEF